MPYRQRSRRGDDTHPSEQMTDGAISRSQIHGELSFFVPVGTPCVVWDPAVKGSALQSKVRRGIAVQKLGKAVQFTCPYTFRKFKSRSYLAIKLKEGINYHTFLGLKSPPMAQSCFVTVKMGAKVIITIPELPGTPNQIEMPVTNANGSGVISSQPMANIIDENGRLFKPDKNGDFNQVNTDLSEEGTGLLHSLAEKGLVKHGHNDIQVNHVYNDLVAQFSNTLDSSLE